MLVSSIDSQTLNIANRRAICGDPSLVARLYTEHGAAKYALALLQAERNKLSGRSDRTVILKQSIANQSLILSDISSRLHQEAYNIPNTTHPSVPIGLTPILLETIGNQRLDHEALQTHTELLSDLDLAEFERAGKVSGTGFYYLKNAGALLEQALITFALDKCISHGFTPMTTPDIIKTEIQSACGFAPRSDDPQTYFLKSTQNDTCLSATQEFALAGLYANETMIEGDLPKRIVGFGHAFRAEGLAGALNRGLYRVHQFSKVEMFGICKPLDSHNLFTEFTTIQKDIFTDLGLCFRIMNMPTFDLGAPAHIKHDMEAWMPARKAWGEVCNLVCITFKISSASDCTDYQSRRLNIRYLPNIPKSKPEFVSTVNGTAAAIPRLILAILETFQDRHGNVDIPKALWPYMMGGRLRKIYKGKTLLEMLEK